ncbi:MAG: hypothetical protein JWR24_1099 [Actinoallomurus sp.]|jgi:hypothetical protein|nr:hypothetical protein [Actinoallomurus sp.]
MSQPQPIQVQKYLSGMSYPATKEELIEHAKSQNAPKEILEALEKIPDDEYDGPNKVSSAVGDVT